jgi:hypothetical protein
MIHSADRGGIPSFVAALGPIHGRHDMETPRIAGGIAVLWLVSMGAAASATPTRARPSVPAANRGGTLVVKVTDFDPAREKVIGAAVGHSAELLDSHTQVNFEGRKIGWLRFRMPSDRVSRLLPEVRAVGKLYSEHAQTSDHQSEGEELERRIARLREHEQRLDSLLRSSRRMRGSDLLYLQDRLFRASVDESELEQRRVDLRRAAQIGTLTVELFEPEPRRAMDLGNWYASAHLRARTALYRELARGMTVLAYALAFAPLWIPGLALAILLGRWLWRRSRVFVARAAVAAGQLAVWAASAASHRRTTERPTV